MDSTSTSQFPELIPALARYAPLLAGHLAAHVGDGSPPLTQPSVPVHKYDTFVPYSVEIEGDAQSFEQELVRVMADAVDQLHATAFATGTGVGQPTGIITSLIGGASIVTGTTMTAAEVVVIADRLGTRVEIVQHLMGAARRPTLQRGLILWGRVGADSVNDNGFRLLNAAS